MPGRAITPHIPMEVKVGVGSCFYWLHSAVDLAKQPIATQKRQRVDLKLL